MKELMIHVERIVRPVRADASKLRMRRELLAHLEASYEQERAAGRDEAAALAEAKRRLGDPAELTQELQASVPRLERISVTPFPKWVLRVLIIAGVLFPIAVVITPLPAGRVSRDAGNLALITPRHARTIFAAGAVVLEVSLMLSSFCLAGLLRPRVRRSRAILMGVAGIIVQLSGLALVTFALTGHAIPEDLAYAALPQLLIPAFLAFAGIASELARRPAREWLALEIAG